MYNPSLKRFADLDGPDFFPSSAWATRERTAGPEQELTSTPRKLVRSKRVTAPIAQAIPMGREAADRGVL